MTALQHPESNLPPIPNKRYFTIGEVGSLCDVKSHVLRYWEQEFTQLKPTKRRGNRRYYQRHDIELIRLIRSLLYEHGFTIAGARQQLAQALKQPATKEKQASTQDRVTAVAPVIEPPQAVSQSSDDEKLAASPFQGIEPLNPDSELPMSTQIRQALERLSQNIEPLLQGKPD